MRVHMIGDLLALLYPLPSLKSRERARNERDYGKFLITSGLRRGRRGEQKERERGKEGGYVSPNTGTISSGGREGGRGKVGERVASKRQSEVCV